MIKTKRTPFEQAAEYLGVLRPRLSALPRSITDTVREIRLRAGQPAVLELGAGKRMKLGEAVTAEQIGDCVREFCGHSVHSYEKQFREGWLTLRGGHRAGFTGTAVLSGGAVGNLRDISSVNLRIARQYTGCADDLLMRLRSGAEEPVGLLIIGRPMSAKTTVLRDLCRQLSANHKISLIDERAEVAAVHNGVPALDVGENTDVLNNFPKAQGIMTALRSLSPEYVVCDEIGWEVGELTAVANSGVKLILTAHSGSLQQAYSSARINALLSAGGISHIALLGHGKNIGKVEFYGRNKHYNGDFSRDSGDSGGALLFLPPETAGGIAAGA
jgi:stage III sporulation protein AA